MISIWEKETFFAPQDVVIAGSGLSGLWSAVYLKKLNPQLKISIIDRGVIPTGASTRNAGFACFGSLSELVYDARTMGTDNMLQLVEMRYKGLQRIQKFFSAKVIDFEKCGGYELYKTTDNLSASQLQENIAYLNVLLKPVTGKKNTFKLADKALKDFGFEQTKHLVENKLEGALHSGKLVQALLQQAHSLGVQIFTGTEIKAFEKVHNLIVITTNQPFTFSTTQLLICTNAYAQKLLPELDIVPARGQVILTSPINNLPWKGTFHSDEGFYYFRNLGKRVLLGGARNKAFDEERTTEMQTTPLIQKELEEFLEKVILPKQKGLYTIDSRWSGIMAMGAGKMPVVQQVSPGVFCAVRMSGMGVALTPVVGQQVAKLMVNAL